MLEVGRDLGQRFQYKAAAVQGGMGDGEFRRSDDLVAEEENVNVDGARAFVLQAAASHIALNPENRGHELLRCVAGFEGGGAIQKPGLLGELHGLGFVKRRDSYD